MDNQHKMIKGYSDLTQEEIDLMNKIKAKGLELKALCDEVYESLIQTSAKVALQDGSEECSAAFSAFHNAEPYTWFHEGRRKLQCGLMALTRAVARPGGF